MWEIIFYRSEDGNVKINAFFENETLWMSQNQIAEVFEVDISTINEHLKNIYESWELTEEWTIGKFPIVQKEGNREVKREINFYNLDGILSVGYRVNSLRATQFRRWANGVLKEYIIKGFAMDDERLKNGASLGKDYFEELLARIREIRASERIFYRKVTDIYATSHDYDPKTRISQDFFAEVQNKFLYAVSEKTAPELIYFRADAKKPNMWLTTWKWQKTGDKIVDTDICVGKNYLSAEELENLHLLVSWYLDYAELQAKKWNIMYMKDWIEKTKNFLSFNEVNILEWKWKISKESADRKAKEEFQKFRISQDREYLSDFDKFTQKILKK